MEGAGEPELLLPAGASPHSYSMRPSEAATVQDAAVIFWVGENLSPWMVDPLETLPRTEEIVELANSPGMRQLPFRESADFGTEHNHNGHDEHAHDDHEHEEHAHDDHEHEEHAHDDHEHEEHAHDDHEHEEHAHDDHEHEEHAHDDHEHEEHAHDDHEHEEHAHEEAGHDHHGHDHSGMDPHVWLDPMNAVVMADVMAGTLAEADPENAELYAQNAEAFADEIAELVDANTAELAAVAGKNFVVFHDAYHYYEARFDVEASGAISFSDATAPSAARLTEIQETIEDLDVTCVFAEPQFDDSLVQTVIDGTNAKSGILDPLGSSLEPGPTLYPELIQSITDELVDCLSQG
ncbi:zinc ABC transporter substrate-binding protein [Amaricoccus macauensis]|uniref:zinc ABC transporter substrate-binding protein n=1 Tax=Amaricoccus macauensis TaxID=57001 RepID=UPI003C79895E